MEKEERLNNLRSLTFAENNIEKNVKERVLFKNYKERFEHSLHLWIIVLSIRCSRMNKDAHIRPLSVGYR